MAVERINLMNVPLDILAPEDIDNVVMSLIEQEGVQQIIFLDIWDFLKARRNNEFREMVLNASLILPVSKSLITAAKFLKLPVPIRRRQFDVVIDFLNAIETRFKSIYILGAQKEIIEIAEKNLKSTFPNIKLVGRFAGFYPITVEPNIIKAIVKSEPELVLVSNGVKGGKYWIYRNRFSFKSGIFIYDKHILDIFAKNRRMASEGVFNSGMDYVITVFKNPLRILNFFRYLWFKILILWHRFFKNH